MPIVVAARLRVRDGQLTPEFGRHANLAIEQVKKANGCLATAFLEDAQLTFWNLSIWKDEATMLDYMRSGAHLAAMPDLKNLCDQATILRWEQENADVPTWLEVYARIPLEGRASMLTHPVPEHLLLSFPKPQIKEEA